MLLQLFVINSRHILKPLLVAASTRLQLFRLYKTVLSVVFRSSFPFVSSLPGYGFPAVSRPSVFLKIFCRGGLAGALHLHPAPGLTPHQAAAARRSSGGSWLIFLLMYPVPPHEPLVILLRKLIPYAFSRSRNDAMARFFFTRHTLRRYSGDGYRHQ